MKFKSSLFFSFVTAAFLFTGCSEKSVDADYTRIYKDTKNPKINNSLEMHKYTMRPYNVYGIKYYPSIAKIGEEFDGVASWYGPNFHTKKTSNGEIYDMYDMTAAHKTLPMNTMVKVKNLENGRSIIVRINDRGPFVDGRIIDLSNKAANDIGMIANGTAKVKLTVLGYNGELENSNAPYAAVPKNEVVDTFEPMDIKEDKISSGNSVISPLKKPTVVNNSSNNTMNVNGATIKKVINNQPSVVSSGKFMVQLGAFSQLDGASKVKNEYQKKFASHTVDYEKIMVNGKEVYKVYIKGFSSYEDAQKFKNANNLSSGMIVGK